MVALMAWFLLKMVVLKAVLYEVLMMAFEMVFLVLVLMIILVLMKEYYCTLGVVQRVRPKMEILHDAAVVPQ